MSRIICYLQNRNLFVHAFDWNSLYLLVTYIFNILSTFCSSIIYSHPSRWSEATEGRWTTGSKRDGWWMIGNAGMKWALEGKIGHNVTHSFRRIPVGLVTLHPSLRRRRRGETRRRKHRTTGSTTDSPSSLIRLSGGAVRSGTKPCHYRRPSAEHMNRTKMEWLSPSQPAHDVGPFPLHSLTGPHLMTQR